MLYARFVEPNAGFPRDKDIVKRFDLEIGKLYKVSHVNMSGWYTDIYLHDFGKIAFNSVHFEFEEDGKPIDIYHDPRYNPYMEDEEC